MFACLIWTVEWQFSTSSVIQQTSWTVIEWLQITAQSLLPPFKKCNWDHSPCGNITLRSINGACNASTACDVSPSVNKFILIVISIHLYFNIKHVACQCACCALCFLFSNLLFFRTNKIFNGWCTVLTLLTNGCGCKLLFIFRSGLLNLSFKFFLSLLWWCRGIPHFGLNIDSLPVWSRDIPDTPEPFLMTASSKFT